MTFAPSTKSEAVLSYNGHAHARLVKLSITTRPAHRCPLIARHPFLLCL